MKKGDGGRPHKKLKMDQTNSNQQEENILRESLLSTLEPVLAEDEERGLVMLDVYASNVNPKDASKIIKAIEKFEFPELGHLKRIRKAVGEDKKAPQLSLLLCTKEFWNKFEKEKNVNIDTSNENFVESPVNQKVMDEFTNFLQTYSLSPFPTQVPRYPPISREQYDLWTPIWPCIYRTHIYSTPLPATLSTQELVEMKNFMLVAILAAKEAKSLGQRPVGAILVDPSTKEVVAKGFDQTKPLSSSLSSPPPSSSRPSYFGHPLAHACMNCIADLSRQLVQKYSTPLDATKLPTNRNESVTPSTTPPTTSSSPTSSSPPITSPSPLPPPPNPSTNTPNTQPNPTTSNPSPNLATSNPSTPNSVTSNSSTPNPATPNSSTPNTAKSNSSTPTADPSFIQYLATGYHLYTTKEPCAMCAMALIHSRVTRVIYGTTDPRGALGTQFRVHTVKSLNHHYQVYKGVAKNECQELWR